MPIGTSDGEIFDSEWDYASRLASSGSPVSQNVEDDRTFADKWGGSFGPSEGGPPAGTDPKDWYAPELSKLSPEQRLAKLANFKEFVKLATGDEVDDGDYGRTSEQDLGQHPQESSGIPLKATEKAAGESNSQIGTGVPKIDLKHLSDKLSETWPAKAVKGFIDAVALPHDVYNGLTDPESEEGIRRAANFALIFGTGGMDSAGKEGTVSVVKGAAKDTLTSPLDLERAGDLAKAIRAGLGT